MKASATTTQPPRITPLEPPFDDEQAETLRRWMPPGSGVEPLALFRTLLRHPMLVSRMRPLGAGLLAHGELSARERELAILRASARAGAEYEWGVHVTAFAETAGLDDAQVAATQVVGGDGAPLEERDRLVLAVVDAIHDHADLSDALWARAAETWTPPELLELVVLAAWYRLIASVINVARVPLEPWAARFSAA